MPETSPLERNWFDRVAVVVDHVQRHLDDELDAGALAELSGFSRHHFHRVFRGATGESVMGFCRRLRLERAAQQLRYGDASVTEIAFDVGYGSHEAFTRAFRARFGVPPRTFRATAEPRTMPDVPVTLRHEPARVALALRHVGPYEDCDEVWRRMSADPRMFQALAAQRASVGLVYDDPEITRADRLRYDAGLVLPEHFVDTFDPGGTGMTRREIPAGTYAVAVHRGPYTSILETYVALIGRALPSRGVELAPEPVVEVYLVGPEAPDPEDYVTEVCVRLA